VRASFRDPSDDHRLGARVSGLQNASGMDSSSCLRLFFLVVSRSADGNVADAGVAILPVPDARRCARFPRNPVFGAQCSADMDTNRA
jgi:hypothetical protein